MKKNIKLLNTLFILFVLLAPLHAQTEEDELINSYWLTGRVLIVGCGENYYDMVAAVNTEKGIVIIDSGMSPSLTAKYRAIIEKEFGRSDFKYVINTHHDRDHVNGNQVFKDAEIIAHQNIVKRMKKAAEKEAIKVYVKRQRESIKWRNRLKDTLNKDSDLYKKVRVSEYAGRNMCDDYETFYQLTLPAIMFTDNLILDMGDLKIEVVYFGPGFHTESDIIISIPEENIVFTGDIVRRLSQYSYGVNSKSDFEPWISSIDKILQKNNNVKSVVTIHSGILPGSAFSEFHKTLKKMRDDLQKKESAVDNLRGMISKSGFLKAKNKFESQFLKNKNEEYFIWEADLILLAEEYRKKKEYKEAQIILKMCEKIFPNSTNVLYRQGALFIEAGKTKRAVEAYKNALKIDPLSAGAAGRIFQLKNSNR